VSEAATQAWQARDTYLNRREAARYLAYATPRATVTRSLDAFSFAHAGRDW
jgi:hypothetical protein